MPRQARDEAYGNLTFEGRFAQGLNFYELDGEGGHVYRRIKYKRRDGQLIASNAVRKTAAVISPHLTSLTFVPNLPFIFSDLKNSNAAIFLPFFSQDAFHSIDVAVGPTLVDSELCYCLDDFFVRHINN